MKIDCVVVTTFLTNSVTHWITYVDMMLKIASNMGTNPYFVPLLCIFMLCPVVIDPSISTIYHRKHSAILDSERFYTYTV